MSQGLELIEYFLAEHGRGVDALIIGGVGDTVRRVNPRTERYGQLLDQLALVRERSARRANLVIAAHFLVLALVAYVIFLNAGKPGATIALFVGGSSVVGLLIRNLGELQRDTTRIDLVLAVLPDLDAEDKMKLLQGVVGESRRSGTRRRTSRSPAIGHGAQ